MSQLQERKKDLCTLAEATDWMNFIGVNSINQFGKKLTRLKIASLSEELMRYLNQFSLDATKDFNICRHQKWRQAS